MSKIEVGDIFTTNQGYKLTVVDYNKSNDIKVSFNNGCKKKVTAQQLRQGKVKNPYHACVRGVGFIGEGEWKSKQNGKMTPAYKSWNSMIKRAYDPDYHAGRPTYTNVSVCEKWHNFQNFAEWFYKQPNAGRKGFDLDKDLMVPGNKEYNPHACSFVPRAINSLLCDCRAARSNLPAGVDKCGKKYVAKLTVQCKVIYLGVHSTPNEAYQAYKKAKEKNIKCMANKYKDVLDPKIYKNLIDLEINNI